MKKNLRFVYLYRDGDNYKNWGVAILTGGVTEAELKALDARIRAALDDGEHFIASQIGVVDVFLWSAEANYDPDDKSTYPPDLGAGRYVINEEADHCWHEYDRIELVDDAPTDPRTPEQFVQSIEAASRDGWQVFEPKPVRR